MSAANLVGRLHDALGLDVDPASEQRYTASLSASVASSHSSPALVESLAGRLQNPKDGFESPEAFAAARARVEASRGKAFTDSFVSLLAKLKQDNALSALCREQRAEAHNFRFGRLKVVQVGGFDRLLAKALGKGCEVERELPLGILRSSGGCPTSV